MKLFLTALLGILSLSLFCQDLECKDFRRGKFIIPASDGSGKEYQVIRKRGSQIEIDEKGVEHRIKIKFMGKCSYVMTMDPKSPQFSAEDLFINKAGGIKVYMNRISGDTLFFNSAISADGKSVQQKGIIIKVE